MTASLVSIFLYKDMENLIEPSLALRDVLDVFLHF